jgi:hypothetical protein
MMIAYTRLKSGGTGVDPVELVASLGVDAVRLVVLANGMLLRLGQGDAVARAGAVFPRLGSVGNGTAAAVRVNVGVTSR